MWEISIILSPEVVFCGIIRIVNKAPSDIFPGIIAMKIVDSLRDNQRKDLNVFFLNSFVLGMASYFARYLLVELINLMPWFQYQMFFLEFLVNSKESIVWVEIIWTTVTAIIIGFTISFFINHKILYRIAYRFKLTKKYSDADVWNHVFGSVNIGWIVIRDYDRGHMFEGWVEAYSPTSTTNESWIESATTSCC